MSSSLRRINRELREMQNNPPVHCTIPITNVNFPRIWTCFLIGPADTPYANGHFKVRIEFSKTYPLTPPRIRFRTPIYHCNINKAGVVCIDVLQDEWSAAWTISGVLLGITTLLTECNPFDPLVCKIAEEYLNNRIEHDRKALMWTQRYAKKNQDFEVNDLIPK